MRVRLGFGLGWDNGTQWDNGPIVDNGHLLDNSPKEIIL